MFPSDTDFNGIKIDTSNEQQSKIGRSFVFDFKTGQHQIIDGKIVRIDDMTGKSKEEREKEEKKREEEASI